MDKGDGEAKRRVSRLTDFKDCSGAVGMREDEAKDEKDGGTNA